LFKSFYNVIFLRGGGDAVVHKCSPRFKEQFLLCTLVISHNIYIFWNSYVVSWTFRTHFITAVTMKTSPFPLKDQCLFVGM